MQIDSAISSAVLGYNRATQQLDNAAQSLAVEAEKASPMSTTTDINTELLTMHTAMYNGMASLNVLRTADEMLGTTIDELV